MPKEIIIHPEEIQDSLRKHMLVDGFDMTLDLHESKNGYLYDSKSKRKLLDFFTFFASNPLGMNHPKLNNPEFIEKIGKVALNKPSLSDIYSYEHAAFVETFFRVAVPSYFKYSFFIEGGALAVENTLKAAIDWKVRKNFAKGYKEEKGQQIIHFKEAFHGRTGYTLSLTNTDPNKINYFPKFDWPRVSNPKITFPLNEENMKSVIEAEKQTINEIKDALVKNPDDIAAIIIEPIQGEGGDNHFRKEFFMQLRQLCNENEMLLIFDEVQTGIGLTGKMWAHQYFVKPDLMSFGKKTQVCGILSTDRIDDIEENVFRKSGRINSTWGGNIVDMVRFQRILEVIEEDELVKNAEVMGDLLKAEIIKLSEKYPDKVMSGRGLGLFAAFDTVDTEVRNKILQNSVDKGLMLLGCGPKSIRFRPPLTVKKEHIEEGLGILDKVLSQL